MVHRYFQRIWKKVSPSSLWADQRKTTRVSLASGLFGQKFCDCHLYINPKQIAGEILSKCGLCHVLCLKAGKLCMAYDATQLVGNYCSYSHREIEKRKQTGTIIWSSSTRGCTAIWIGGLACAIACRGSQSSSGKRQIHRRIKHVVIEQVSRRCIHIGCKKDNTRAGTLYA